MIACPTPTNSQVGGREPLNSHFHVKTGLFCLLLCIVSTSGVCKHPSLFWSVTQSLLGVYQATISHVKEDSNTFHMTSNSLMFINQILIFWLNSLSTPPKNDSAYIHIQLDSFTFYMCSVDRRKCCVYFVKDEQPQVERVKLWMKMG